jgi:signal transduction histidine kinase
MSAAWGSFSVHLPEFARTTTFRWTLAVAVAFVLYTVVLFGFVYWQTASYLSHDSDVLLADELRVFAENTPDQRLAEIDDRLHKDPRHVKVGGLFGADGHRLAGNIESLPPRLVPDMPSDAVVVRLDGGDREMRKVRLAAHPLPDGEVLVIGRNIDEIEEIAEIVGRALGLGLLPAFGMAVAIGMVLSVRALERLSDVNRRIQRIVAGDLRERLPTRGRNDPFDQLAVSVNKMLGEMEALIQEIAGVGDDIAHDLRTPLTRVRVRLERGRERAATLGELRLAVEQAIDDHGPVARGRRSL